MTTADRQDRIERYLRGRMTEAERADFQTDLLFDADLKRDLAATRTLQKTLRARQPKPPRRGGAIWFAAILLLVGLLGIGFWSRGVGSDVRGATDSTGAPGTESSVVLPLERDSIRKLPTDADTTNVRDTPPIDPTPPRAEPSEAEERTDPPIAYAPNPALEGAAVGLLRGLDYTLRLVAPDERLRANDPLVFSGTVGTQDDAPALELHLLSNRPADYQNRNYLRSLPLELRPTSSGYRFGQRLEMDLEDGRYYWLLEDVNEERTIRVGWFEVREARSGNQ